MANSYFNENTLEELIEEIKYVYKSDDRPWVIGYSGGKDSTTVVELVYKMLLGLDPDDRHKNVYIVSSDTLIENPLIKIYLSKMNDLLGQAADRDGLPIKSAMVTPPPNNSFWANVIGRGFPTPRMNGTFRWCTDRLKINPSGEYIQRVIDEEGKEVVVLLGVCGMFYLGVMAEEHLGDQIIASWYRFMLMQIVENVLLLVFMQVVRHRAVVIHVLGAGYAQLLKKISR